MEAIKGPNSGQVAPESAIGRETPGHATAHGSFQSARSRWCRARQQRSVEDRCATRFESVKGLLLPLAFTEMEDLTRKSAEVRFERKHRVRLLDLALPRGKLVVGGGVPHWWGSRFLRPGGSGQRRQPPHRHSCVKFHHWNGLAVHLTLISSSKPPEGSTMPFGPPCPWPGLETSTPSRLLPWPLLGCFKLKLTSSTWS